MNIILLTGRGGSQSIPNKNMHPVLGRPLAYYPIVAAKEANLVDDVYISTDSTDLKQLAVDLDVKIIDRPPEISQKNSELVKAIQHALDSIDQEVDILVTMHCNNAVHRPGIVDECISKLQAHPEADSCVTGFTDRSVHPYRTKQIGTDGYLHTWMDIPENTSTNRQSLAGCFILDGGVRAMRVDRCFPPSGQPPFCYLGNNILPIENTRGGDIHSLEDVALAEYRLRELGWQEE